MYFELTKGTLSFVGLVSSGEDESPRDISLAGLAEEGKPS